MKQKAAAVAKQPTNEERLRRERARATKRIAARVCPWRSSHREENARLRPELRLALRRAVDALDGASKGETVVAQYDFLRGACMDAFPNIELPGAVGAVWEFLNTDLETEVGLANGLEPHVVRKCLDPATLEPEWTRCALWEARRRIEMGARERALRVERETVGRVLRDAHMDENTRVLEPPDRNARTEDALKAVQALVWQETAVVETDYDKLLSLWRKIQT